MIEARREYAVMRPWRFGRCQGPVLRMGQGQAEGGAGPVRGRARRRGYDSSGKGMDSEAPRNARPPNGRAYWARQAEAHGAAGQGTPELFLPIIPNVTESGSAAMDSYEGRRFSGRIFRGRRRAVKPKTRTYKFKEFVGVFEVEATGQLGSD